MLLPFTVEQVDKARLYACCVKSKVIATNTILLTTTYYCIVLIIIVLILHLLQYYTILLYYYVYFFIIIFLLLGGYQFGFRRSRMSPYLLVHPPNLSHLPNDCPHSQFIINRFASNRYQIFAGAHSIWGTKVMAFFSFPPFLPVQLGLPQRHLIDRCVGLL